MQYKGKRRTIEFDDLEKSEVFGKIIYIYIYGIVDRGYLVIVVLNI